MPDPVAWILVEPGWAVVDVDGRALGTVADVRGDAEADIFDGLTVNRGLLGRSEYVPSERVAEIRIGRVVLAADTEGA